MVDLTPFIEILTVAVASGVIGFVVAEVAGYFNTRSANNSIVQTSSTAINALVSMTGVMVNAEQAMAISEITGVPTQIITAEKAK